MNVVKLNATLWQASYKGISCIGNSFTDAVRATYNEYVKSH